MPDQMTVCKGHVFTVDLTAASGTRHSWVLCSKPDGIGMVDISLEHLSRCCGGPAKKTFWLVALESGTFTLVFQLLPLNPLEAPAEIVTITVKVVESGAKNAIDASTFVKIAGNTASYASDACKPHPEIVVKYAAPYAFGPCHEPVSMYNMYPVLKYGICCGKDDSSK